MRAISAALVSAIIGARDFSQAGVAVDVGGGTGELLERFPGDVNRSRHAKPAILAIPNTYVTHIKWKTL